MRGPRLVSFARALSRIVSSSAEGGWVPGSVAAADRYPPASPPQESADEARLALRVVRAGLDGLREGLLVFFVGVVLLRVAAAVYFLTHLLVAAAPVVMLASGITIASFLMSTRA